ncbi:hypothetical protein J3R83DRAFT_12412 [Lanmaoa asiatica]|nr:hypothetical protein J3R83DRAFT_12412 [Lanmaoa asiatica]
MGYKVELDNLSRNRNAYALALSASMGSIFFGWDMGLIGGILSLASFQQYFGINKMSASAQANLNGNIVSVLQAGCFFGAVSTGYISGRFGRKKPLVISGLIYLLGSIVQTVSGIGSSQVVALRVLYFGRFLGGFGLGVSTALIPSYVSECTPKAIRGRCTGLIQVSNNIGMMLSFWVNYGSSLHVPSGQMQWRMPFAVQVVPGIFFVLFMLPQPESPRWLVEQQRYEEAAKSLAYATRSSVDDEAVLATLAEIKADLAGKHGTSIWKQFRMMGESRVTALRAFIPSLVMLCQQWTGTNAINYFSPQIFAGLGITGTSAGLFATGVYGVVKAVAVTATVIFAVEGMGRKMCLFIGGQRLSLRVTSLSSPSTFTPVFYCFGFGPNPWVVAGEVAPNHVRTAAMSLAVGVNWLFAFTISRVTPNMLEEIKYGTFLVFGMCCMLMSVWVYFCLPETKGYALEDIRFLFEKDMLVRALEDAPGGRIFLGGRRSTPVAELRRAATDLEDTVARSSESDEKHLPPIATKTTIPGAFSEEDEDDGSSTAGEDDVPPAFPAPNSAQRATPSSSTQSTSQIPTILTDNVLMPPPPLPDLASRQPGVSRAKPQIASSSLLAPMTTSERPKKPSRKVALAPGYGPLDWASLKSSGGDLRGVETLLRIPPSVLKMHDKKEDAWTTINGKVYNITPYLPYHPGGEKELMRVAGRDGTKLFCEILIDIILPID